MFWINFCSGEAANGASNSLEERIPFEQFGRCITDPTTSSDRRSQRSVSRTVYKKAKLCSSLKLHRLGRFGFPFRESCETGHGVHRWSGACRDFIEIEQPLFCCRRGVSWETADDTYALYTVNDVENFYNWFLQHFPQFIWGGHSIYSLLASIPWSEFAICPTPPSPIGSIKPQPYAWKMGKTIETAIFQTESKLDWDAPELAFINIHCHSIYAYSLDISSKIVNGLSLKVRKFGPITGSMKRHGKALWSWSSKRAKGTRTTLTERWKPDKRPFGLGSHRDVKDWRLADRSSAAQATFQQLEQHGPL